LQEIILSSDEEDHFASGSNFNSSLSSQFMTNRSKNIDSQNDDAGEDDEEEDDDEDDDIS